MADMPPVPDGYSAVDVLGVRVEIPSNQPIVLLRQIGTNVHVPIWIGPSEAAAIAMVQQGVVPDRPMTHDLFASTLRALGIELHDVRITDLVGGVFMAELRLGATAVGARPSDGIALALRMGAPVYVAAGVIVEAGVEISEDPEEEVDRFRVFLDSIKPEDFQ
jgi:bifunctional DNase/RNase